MISAFLSGALILTSPGADPVPDPVALVKQLGSEDFAERESAEKQLKELGLKAEPALKAGLKSESPEVRLRAAQLLATIRKEALDSLAKTFDPSGTDEPDHPIWKRYKTMARDTRASRELFSRVVKNPEWRRSLGAAESGPNAAAKQYCEAISGIAARVRMEADDPFPVRVAPCDSVEQVAYLLFLGAFPGTEKVSADDLKLDDLRVAEIQLFRGSGLYLGLQGRQIAIGRQSDSETTTELAPGSAVFARLLTAWLARHRREYPLVRGFRIAMEYRIAGVLELARTAAANGDYERETRLAALSVVAQFGDRADLPLFEPLFDDKEVSCTVIGTSPKGFSRNQIAEYRDVAVALALLLCDQNPNDFGFDTVGRSFRRENRRPVVAQYANHHFGFAGDADRSIAHEQARDFFFKQKRINDQTAPPPRAINR